MAKTGVGNACTQGKPKIYESENIDGIRIWDSKGIESRQYNIVAASSDIDETINSQLETHDPDRFIHCIWLCIHSNRFVEDEFKNLKKIYKSYLTKLPVIVIYSKAIDQKEADEMICYIEEELNKEDDNDQIKVLKVLAKDYKYDNGSILKSFGIYKLMKETSDRVKQGIESSCIQALMNEGENILKTEFKEIINKLKTKYFTNILENVDDISFSDINILNSITEKNQPLNLDLIIFDSNYFLKFVSNFSIEIASNLIHKEKLNENSIKSLHNLIEIKCNDIKNYFLEQFEKKLDDSSNELAEKLDGLTRNLDSKYNIIHLSNKFSHSQLKIQAKNYLRENLKQILEHTIYKEMSSKLFDNYSEEFSNKLLSVYHDMITGEKMDKEIKKIFKNKGKENAKKYHTKLVESILMNFEKDDFEIRNKKKKKRKK